MKNLIRIPKDYFNYIIALAIKSFLLLMIFSTHVIAQLSPCANCYSIDIDYLGPCDYHFTALSNDCEYDIQSVTWEIYSGSIGGSGSTLCDELEGNDVYYTFCFNGNHHVRMILDLGEGGYCYVEENINVLCSNSLPCDPNPSHTLSQHIPRINIAYTDGCYPCDAIRAWYFAFRPYADFNCDPYIYKVYYRDPCNGWQCVTLTPNVVTCLCITDNNQVTVRAEANNCCLVAGRKWYYIFTPSGTTNPTCCYPADCAYWCAANPSCSNSDDLKSMNHSAPSPDPIASCLLGQDHPQNHLEYNNSELKTKDENSLFKPLFNEGNLMLNAVGNSGVINLYSINGARMLSNYNYINVSQSLYLSIPDLDYLSPGMYIVECIDQSGKRLVSKVFKN
jgi:hypothetical protein